MKIRTRRRVESLFLTTVMLIITIIMIFPLYWITTMSLMDGKTASSYPPQFLFIPTMENFVNLWNDSHFEGTITNSIVLTLGNTILAIILGTPAAYALARYKLGPSEHISFAVLSIRILPAYIAVFPMFLLLLELGIFGTRLGVIIAISLVSISFVIWMMRAFFMAIPVELEEAAIVDGCTRFGALIRIVLPVAAPGLVTTAVFTSIIGWNDLIFCLILGGEYAKNLPVALAGLVTEFRSEWGQLAAGGVITMMPVVVFSIFVRKYFLAGLTAGSVTN